MAKGPKPPSKPPSSTLKSSKVGTVPQSTSNPTGRPPKKGK